MKNKPLFFSVFLFMLISSCSNKSSDPLSEFSKIDSIQRRAHYTGDADLLCKGMPDSFYMARNGKIQWSTRSQMKDRFTKYFTSTTYSEWENIVPPIITLSDDEKMAVITYNKRTTAIITDSLGQKTTQKANFSWAAIMKKENKNWKLIGIVTTDDQLR